MKKNTKVTSKINDIIANELKEECARRNMTLSSLICHILTDYIFRMTGKGDK